MAKRCSHSCKKHCGMSSKRRRTRGRGRGRSQTRRHRGGAMCSSLSPSSV